MSEKPKESENLSQNELQGILDGRLAKFINQANTSSTRAEIAKVVRDFQIEYGLVDADERMPTVFGDENHIEVIQRS